MGAWDYVSTLTLDTNGYDEQLNNAVKSTKKFQEQTEQTNKELGELRQQGGKAQSTFQDYAKKVGLSEKATLKMGKAINIATKSVAAVGVAIGVAKVAYEGWKVELSKTDQGVEKLEVHQLKVNNAIKLFKESLLTFDFGNFDSKLREINKSLEQMYYAFNKLNRMKMSGDANLAKNEMQREQLRSILDDRTIPANDQRKIKAAEQMKKLEQEAIDIANIEVELAQKALQKSLENAATTVRHDHDIFGEVTWHNNKGNEQSYKPQFTQGLIGDIMSTLTDAKEYYKIINMSSQEVRHLYNELRNSGQVAQRKVSTSGTGYGGGYYSATIASRNSDYENVLINYDQKLLDEYMKVLTIRNMPIEQLEQYMNTLQYKYNLQTEIIGKNNQSMTERQQAEEDAAKAVADRVKAEEDAAKALKLSNEKEINATKEFIKKLLNADSKYTTKSGISISYDPISKSIEKLSNEQALTIESLYNSFETSIANFEEQFKHNDINSGTYYNQVEHSLNILIDAVKTISPDIAQALENSIMSALPANSPIKKVDAELLMQHRNAASDAVNNTMEMLISSWSMSDLSKEQLENYRSANLNEVYNQYLDKLLTINATSDGSQDFGKMSNLILGKSLEEQISILQEWEKIWGDFNNTLSENDPSYKILNEIGEHNFNSIYNALDVLLYKYAAITEEQKRLQEQAEKMEGIAEIVNGIGNAFSAWSGVFDEATAQWVNWVGTFISGIAEMLPHIQTLIAAKHAESLAEGTAGAAKVPFPGNIPAILSIIGIIGSIFASMPKFAGGGIFDGVTSMGDYNIARVNKGEMILNSTQQGRLFRMLNSGNPAHISNVSGDVTFKIQGTQLVGVLNNYEKIHKRTL